MAILIILSTLFCVLPGSQSLFDKPITVSCTSNFDPSNWTHYAFILQTMIMILIACFGFYYIYRRYGCKCRSRDRSIRQNCTTSCTHSMAQPYAQAPMSTGHPPVAFYAMMPPTAPLNHNPNSGSSTQSPIIVS